MEQVVLDKGFSYYKGKCIGDRHICDLVGLETYKALYELFPHCWVDLTYPMTAKEDHLHRIQTLLVAQEGLTGECLKRRLVIRHVDGPTQSASELVAGLVHSSPPMDAPSMSPLTFIIWILWMFVTTIIAVLVITFYIWPEVKEYASYKGTMIVVPSPTRAISIR